MFFGFGVGDFLAISALAVRAYSCLQDSTGSRADYQSLRMIRQSVGNTRRGRDQPETQPRMFPSIAFTYQNVLREPTGTRIRYRKELRHIGRRWEWKKQLYPIIKEAPESRGCLSLWRCLKKFHRYPSYQTRRFVVLPAILHERSMEPQHHLPVFDGM